MIASYSGTEFFGAGEYLVKGIFWFINMVENCVHFMFTLLVVLDLTSIFNLASHWLTNISLFFSFVNFPLMMVNGFCGMVDRWNAFSLISSQDYYKRSSLSQISDMLRAGFEPAQNLRSDFVEWSCAVAMTYYTTVA